MLQYGENSFLVDVTFKGTKGTTIECLTFIFYQKYFFW